MTETVATILAVGTFFANTALVGAIVFVLSYGIFFRWYQTSAGQSIMAFASSIVAMGLLSLMFREGRDLLVYGWTRLAIMVGVASAVWAMVYVLWSTRHKETLASTPRTTGPLGFRTLTKENHPVNNNDRIIAYIRTAVPTAVGALLAWLISRVPAVADWLAAIDAQLAVFGGFGVTATGLLIAGAIAGVTFAYYALARYLGEKFPWVEKWLLGRSAVPVYLRPEEATVITEAIPVVDDRSTHAKNSLTFGEDVIVHDTGDSELEK